MDRKTWDFLKVNHQWFLLFAVVCMFGSLLAFTMLEAKNARLSADMLTEAKNVVTVAVDGIELEVQTSSNTVAGVLKELGLYIGKNDKIYPAQDTLLTDVSLIEVLRTTKKNQVIALGVEEIVTREGVTFSYEKVIEDAELTAYSAGHEHTGKNPGDRGYGITFTGTTVEDGRTVAVDPKVIPLGWWMYIEGIGFRKSEDTGSAVKNKRVDIYYDDNDFALRFGLKRNVMIYVIGPNDPRR